MITAADRDDPGGCMPPIRARLSAMQPVVALWSAVLEGAYDDLRGPRRGLLGSTHDGRLRGDREAARAFFDTPHPPDDPGDRDRIIYLSELLSVLEQLTGEPFPVDVFVARARELDRGRDESGSRSFARIAPLRDRLSRTAA